MKTHNGVQNRDKGVHTSLQCISLSLRLRTLTSTTRNALVLALVLADAELGLLVDRSCLRGCR